MLLIEIEKVTISEISASYIGVQIEDMIIKLEEWRDI